MCVAQVPATYFMFGYQWTKIKRSLHRQYVCFWSWRFWRQTASNYGGRYQLILGKVFPFSLQIKCEVEQLRLESSHGVLLNIQGQNLSLVLMTVLINFKFLWIEIFYLWKQSLNLFQCNDWFIMQPYKRVLFFFNISNASWDIDDQLITYWSPNVVMKHSFIQLGEKYETSWEIKRSHPNGIPTFVQCFNNNWKQLFSL